MRRGEAGRGVAVLLVLAVAGCAQPRQPPGGEEDRTPPRVVGITPAPLSTITDLRQPVVIRFDERLSERLEGVGELRDAVLVSPETGEVQARRGRREVEIKVAGGWQPGLVYRIVVLPVFRDLFNNLRTEPIELVFSTGAPIQETAIAGFVEDRLTGLPVPAARVEATRRLDGHRYVARTDTAGFFAMRYAPAGAYDLRAWLDRNRNRVPDFNEPQDTGQMVLGYQDTVVVEMRLLPPDTTAARLVRAAPLDSMTIELGFDDYFAVGPVPGMARLFRLEDSTLVAEGGLVHGTRLDSIRAARRDAAETEPMEEGMVPAMPDTLPPTDTVVRRERAPAPTSAQPRTRPLPVRELIFILPGPLQPETGYFVEVRDVVNIQGVPGGGGSARFRTPARPAPAPEEPPATPPAPDTVPDTGSR